MKRTKKKHVRTPEQSATSKGPVAPFTKRKATGEDPASFPVVGIGASAGGLEALEAFFSEVVPNSGMAYIVVTHQAPGRASLLPELLAKHSRVPMHTAEDGMKLVPDAVFVAPPGGCVSVRDERIQIEEIDPSMRTLPVDHLFRSLAKNDGDNAIAIVLSGNGRDGTLGITEVKGVSGMVMAQEPSSARYAGMPTSAIATQLVDYVLPPNEMPVQLLRYVQGKDRLRVSNEPKEEPDTSTAGLQRVLVILRARTGNDFASYKKSTVRRRVERRMTVHGLRSVAEYAQLLERAPHEVDALFRELLISVTSFFRDPEAYAVLESELQRIIKLKADDDPVRIWVAGCATGEEAYSLAILVKEALLAAGRSLAVQIFATDLDSQAVETARAGRYPEGIAADVSPERLERFFTKEEGGYRVTKDVRELLVFASQNLVKDPPFTKLDLLSCRNLLIYLESELQKRILWLFSYSLRPAGILFLGTSESVAGFDDVFTVVDKKWKVFQRRDSGGPRLPDLHQELPPAAIPGRLATAHRPGHRAVVGVGLVAERLLLSSFVPPTVILSERGELIYLHGRTGSFLEPAAGEPTNNVFNMAREGLRLELPAAMRQASTSVEPVVRRGLQVKTNGGFSSVRLTVRKLDEPESLRGAFIATFEEEKDEPKKPKVRSGKSDRGHIERISSLERELQRTKENLQGTIEELETSNEELKSTNEELQSTNEELQSANEELETSREEMQSLNEELQTVNSELEERNRALSQANDDMQNLLNSTEIATIFLDDKLAIKRFTTQAKKVFSLIDTDIGRPISDLTANLRYDHLVEEAREVLQTLVFREREIQTKEGSWRLMRVMPYRTHENLIDGLVITFVDIDRVKRAEEEAQMARLYAESIVEAVRVSLLVLDTHLRVVSANRAFYEQFRTTPKLLVGEPIQQVSEGRWDAPDLDAKLRRIAKGDQEVMTASPVTVTLPRVGPERMTLNARRIVPTGDKPLILLAIESLNNSPKKRDEEG
ncbi:MAG TPA: CheR family methyltransferase [Polyangiaceae bacterium]|nr:CheR family methyltransferase [Polyangiaceae bacterium]